eukprot:m.105803 g.105803  ORF g.105803 m.105803 type:complete len:532 (+) comp15292_c0_seq1:180-1775(+)
MAVLSMVIGVFAIILPVARGMNAVELQQATDAAIASGQPALDVPAGSYFFNNTNFLIAGAHNLVIQGQADSNGIPTTTLWFALGGDVSVLNSHSVTLRNIAIDFNGTYAQGTVLKMADDGLSFTATFGTELLLPDTTSVPFFQPPFNVSIKVCFWHPNNRTMVRNDGFAGAINVFMTSSTSMGPMSPDSVIFKITVSRNVTDYLGPLPSGAFVTLMPRGYEHSLLVYNTSDSLFDNVHVYGGGSMGVVDSGGEGNNRYHGLNMTRRPFMASTGVVVDRLLSVNADGFHSTSNTLGPIITNSVLSWTGDDLMNICSAMMIVMDAWQPAANKLRVAVFDNAHYLSKIQSGDRHSFYHLNTEAYQATAVVDSIALSTNSTILSQATSLFRVLSNPPYNAHFERPVLASGNRPYELEITLTGGSQAAIAGYWSLIHFDRFKNVGATVQNSHLHDGYARIFLVKGSNSTITNNVFERAGGVHMGPEQSWLEGDPGMTNIVFADNVLRACGEPAIQQQPCLAANHANVSIVNNTVIP